MYATPRLPLLKRLPPGVWTALAWGVGAAFTFLIRVRLPGEEQPAVLPGVFIYRWDGLAVLTVATALSLAGSRLLSRRPLPALALLLAGAAVATTPLSVGEIPLAQFLAVDVALYFIAATRPRRTGIIALTMALGVLAGYLTTRLLSGWTVGTSAELAVALTSVIAWLIGHSTHQAREYAEKSRAQAAAQAVTAERLRIARELHDMVAHSIGIIALQAGAARRVIDSRPAAARDALSAIETAGRETLSGLRRMLGALRQAGPGQAPQVAPLDPALGLADVDRLAATTTAAGVRVDVRWRGERRPLPPEIDVSAYRIVQEAVTNVVRHAGTDSCRVSIDCRDEELSIEVLDSGRGGRGGSAAGTAAGTGWGLLGMRERVGLLHGEFAAAARPEGGFRVTARLPAPREPAVPPDPPEPTKPSEPTNPPEPTGVR
ncbi:histidine kinase [Streptomyces sp. A3M-1-3]|uniref:sensor histidine kinase n=1 Tax=Streptomyces sp. A3M-1-3 TaxID=2962044 RepID=UPI0020B8D6FF|nr:histidine kinase [Streptomyces sp. A3M-1-3]MCP3817901.1 histidine kinase [Streptomyces sp. A3M-1-3]